MSDAIVVREARLAPVPLTVYLAHANEPVERPDGSDAASLFADRRDVIVARVNGELVDLATRLVDGDSVEPVTAEDPEGLAVLRHSCAHVLAQAVQQVNPDAKLGIGPPIKDGFYYDFDVARPFTPDDLAELEKRMTAIIKAGQKFARRVVTDDEARTELEFQPYKLLLIDAKGGGPDAAQDPDIMEVGGAELTMYDNVDRRDQTVWTDLCRGPHVPTTRFIPANAFKLMRTAAVYWLSDERNPQLQRIYGTAWATKDDMRAHLTFLEEAAKRDHRRLGAELDLFSFPEQIGSGLAVFHPKGGVVRREMEDYSRRRHEEAGYEFVNTPHITKGALFATSGHLDWYADGMYPPMHLDADFEADGTVRKPGQDYYLKPMNCPMHNLIFDARGRSYRELPLRMFEFGTVYRYEKSGVVHGLTRVRGMTQDDAHIYCTPEQLEDEVLGVVRFMQHIYASFGFSDVKIELSTRPAKSIGSDQVWELAEGVL
ncbi:MAG: threonyl-tRNA synthetase, partial [Actinomycetota bacterium]|nr:threonyl-tRNA synthetase [Actinomycetota bacterium]